MKKSGMIRDFLRSARTNFIYLFIAMGIFYLFLLIAIFWFVSAAMNTAGETAARLIDLVASSVAQSSASVEEFLSYAFGQLQWDGNLFAFVLRLLDPAWIKSTIVGFFEVLNVSTEGFDAQFASIAQNFTATLKAEISAALVCAALGVIFANLATRYAIRRRSVKRGFKRFLVAHTLVPVAQSLVLIAAVLLLSIIHFYGILLFAAILLLSSGLALFSSWLVHRDGTLRLKDVITVRNVLSQLAVSGIVLAFDLVLGILLLLINPLLAILIMIPFLLYSFNLADVNADRFVCTLTDQNEA